MKLLIKYENLLRLSLLHPQQIIFEVSGIKINYLQKRKGKTTVVSRA